MRITAKFREFENGATKGFADVFVNGTIGIKSVALVEGEHGMFVSMPQRKVGEEYRDVISGVSKEFSAQVLEAVLAAKDSPEHHATVGESGKLYCEPHVTALQNPEGSVKALASLTVRPEQGAEKSAFTIHDIRVIQGEKSLFLGMPNVKTNNPEYEYNDLCIFTKDNKSFLDGLIIGKAMDALGMEKKSKLDDRLGEAKEKAGKKKAEPAPKKEKEAERAE